MSQSAAKDVISAIRFYVDKIVSDPALEGMKALILDPVTTRIISMVYSQTQILEKEVYLVELLGKKHEGMNHLKAAVFIQPTEDNFKLLANELHEPKYKEYHIFFSNIVSQDMLARLGRMDEKELIKQVQEYFGDYLAINEDFFHLGLNNSLLNPNARSIEAGLGFERNVNGVLSVLLSMKRCPSLIRYQNGSEMARRLATEINKQVEQESGLFDFRRQEGPLLLVLDRRDDPVTPLLTQWTYQAMVHELLGLHHNRVRLKDAPNITKELEEVVLSPTQDDFFAKHRHANFGDLGAAVKAMLNEYQKHAKKNENINSIEDMQNFMERYPDFRSKSINVSKHVAVISELSRLTDVCQLLDISELEQEIACSNDHSLHKQELIIRIRSSKVKRPDKVRLTLLYLLKYESYNETRELKQLLQEQGIQNEQLAELDSLLLYAGDSKRAAGLFSSGGIMAKLTKSFSSVGGAQNVYTQHQPLLLQTLDAIVKGKVKDAAFPPITMGAGSSTSSRPNEVLVFMIGGATFEEATKVSEFNAQNPGVRVILGGSCVHNSTSFLRDVMAFAASR